MQLRFWFLLTGWVLTGSLIAQNPQMTSAAESDPEAKAVLQKVRKLYEGYKTLDIDFSINIEVPEQKPTLEKGKLSQSGAQYKLDLPKQAFISDGKTLWVHLKNKKEVQINSAEDGEEGSLSPRDLLKIYERKDFVYVLVNEVTDKKRTLQQVELKPLDRNADYHKIRLEVDKKTGEIVTIKAFFKDGVRYSVQVDKLTPNKTFAAGFFTFDPKANPSVKVEDLRID